MRVFKSKWFVRFARRENITDAEFCAAVARAENGLIDADLGSGVIKQRLSRPKEGESGGFRSIVLFRSGLRSFFVYGFPKSARDNVRKDELQSFKDLADEMLGYDDAAITASLGAGAIVEVMCDGEDDRDLPE